MNLFFFFSSRRRHTSWPRDWSSDVCSSDLQIAPSPISSSGKTMGIEVSSTMACSKIDRASSFADCGAARRSEETRSEERRVGKEGRERWAPEDRKKKENDDKDVTSHSTARM